MTVALTIAAAFVLAALWSAWLDYRYGSIVSPDQSIPAGLALLAGWAVLIVVTATLVLVELI